MEPDVTCVLLKGVWRVCQALASGSSRMFYLAGSPSGSPSEIPQHLVHLRVFSCLKPATKPQLPGQVANLSLDSVTHYGRLALQWVEFLWFDRRLVPWGAVCWGCWWPFCRTLGTSCARTMMRPGWPVPGGLPCLVRCLTSVA